MYDDLGAEAVADAVLEIELHEQDVVGIHLAVTVNVHIESQVYCRTVVDIVQVEVNPGVGVPRNAGRRNSQRRICRG